MLIIIHLKDLVYKNVNYQFMLNENCSLKIYTPSNELLDEWQSPYRKQLQGTSNLNEALAQPFKIAIISSFGNCAGAPWNDPNLFDLDLSQIDLVLIKEYLWRSFDNIQKNFILKNKIKNFIITSNEPIEENNSAIYGPYWFVRPSKFSEIKNINYNISKKYTFDALLGSPRSNRFFVLAKLKNNKELFEKSVITFRKEFLYDDQQHEESLKIQDQRIQELCKQNQVYFPFVSSTMNNAWENVDKEKFNRKYFIDGLDIPWKVYENTWYSICTETSDYMNFCDDSTKLSGITSKLILAKRVFVMFGTKGILGLLKQLNFKTFDNIIDESYDNEHDPFVRFEKAFKQLELLAKLDPFEVYKKTEDIREHNFQRLFDLNKELRNKHNELLLKKIPLEFCK